jgi:hypothetical protein
MQPKHGAVRRIRANARVNGGVSRAARHDVTGSTSLAIGRRFRTVAQINARLKPHPCSNGRELPAPEAGQHAGAPIKIARKGAMAYYELQKIANRQFFDQNDVARFFRRVATAEVVSESTLLRDEGVVGGGVHIDTLKDRHVLDARSHLRAQMMMQRFSAICVKGTPADALAYLELQRHNYFRACRQINKAFAEWQELNTWFTRTMVSGRNAALITHGATTIVSAVISLVPGASTAATAWFATLKATVDLLTDPKLDTVIMFGLDKAVDRVSTTYWDRATKTLNNIVAHDWKIPGTLLNAQVRLKTQMGIIAGAAAVRVAIAAVDVYQGVWQIKEGYSGFARPCQSFSLDVVSTPALSAPSPVHPPATSSKPSKDAPSGKDTPSVSKSRTDWSALDEAIMNGDGL